VRVIALGRCSRPELCQRSCFAVSTHEVGVPALVKARLTSAASRCYRSFAVFTEHTVSTETLGSVRKKVELIKEGLIHML